MNKTAFVWTCNDVQCARESAAVRTARDFRPIFRVFAVLYSATVNFTKLAPERFFLSTSKSNRILAYSRIYIAFHYSQKKESYESEFYRNHQINDVHQVHFNGNIIQNIWGFWKIVKIYILNLMSSKCTFIHVFLNTNIC